jgi:class 3 adenylate cyclase
MKEKKALPFRERAVALGLYVIFSASFTTVVHQLTAELDVGIQFAQQERMGLQYNYPLRELLEYLIEYRALISALQTESRANLGDLTRKKILIDRKIEEIAIVDRELGKKLNTTEDWKVIEKAWNELSHQNSSVTLQNQQTQCTNLINRLLSLITHVGDTSNLILDPALDSYYLMDTVVNNLPQLTVQTSAAIELGDATIRSGQQQTEDKVTLLTLKSISRDIVRDLERGLSVAYGHNAALKLELRELPKKTIDESDRFLNKITDLLQLSSQNSINLVDFRVAGQHALDHQLSLYDAVSPSLDRLLQQRLQEFYRKKYGAIALAALVLTASTYVFFTFYQNLINRRKLEKELKERREESDKLLLNILPSPIAEQLKQKNETIAEHFPEVTVLFADLVGFTEASASMSPIEMVKLLNQIFSMFDRLAEEHGLEKIKTIGDAYMVVGGIPYHRQDHAEAIADMAIDMQIALQKLNAKTGQSFQMRVGINTGPVIAGVIGIKKFIYDLWGDTVNIASRMESHGEAEQIQVTEATYLRLHKKYIFEERGEIHVKGKGSMTTYWLRNRAISRLSSVA